MKSFAAGLLVALFAVPAFTAPAVAGVKEGVDAWQAGNYPKALAEWRGPAQAGDPDAQFNLAQAYKLGRGVPADLKLAQDWYQKAAVQGHEQAQANLGLILFQNGDRRGAMPWIQKAADRGEPRAQYVLGTALFNGDLMTRDWPKAYALMTRAAAAGLPQAATSLSQMDQYVPLVQRQQGIALAKTLDAAPPPAPAAAKPAPAPAKSSPVKTVPLPASEPAKPVAVAAAKPTPAPKPAPAAKPVSAAKPEATASGWRIQLGAFGTEAKAKNGWAGMSARPGLKGLQPSFVAAGAVTRLQAGPFASRAAADRSCKAAGVACFVVAP
jgi:cell division septation protein DedD